MQQCYGPAPKERTLVSVRNVEYGGRFVVMMDELCGGCLLGPVDFFNRAQWAEESQFFCRFY